MKKVFQFDLHFGITSLNLRILMCNWESINVMIWYKILKTGSVDWLAPRCCWRRASNSVPRRPNCFSETRFFFCFLLFFLFFLVGFCFPFAFCWRCWRAAAGRLAAAGPGRCWRLQFHQIKLISNDILQGGGGWICDRQCKRIAKHIFTNWQAKKEEKESMKLRFSVESFSKAFDIKRKHAC